MNLKNNEGYIYERYDGKDHKSVYTYSYTTYT